MHEYRKMCTLQCGNVEKCIGLAWQVDVWAAGVCLFVWVWGCLPFQGDSIPDMFTAIKEKPLTFPAHPACDPKLKDLITKASNASCPADFIILPGIS